MLTIEGKKVDFENLSNDFLDELKDCCITGNRRLALEDAILLFSSCREINAKNIVEIGSADGASAQVLGLEAKKYGGHLWCIEPDIKDLLIRNLTNRGVQDYVTVIRAASPWIDVEKTSIELPIDLLFIDGNHRTRWCIVDYHFWERYVRPGGMILFHDYCGAAGNKDQIRRAVDIIMETDKLKLFGTSEPKDKGIIAFRKEQ